MDITNIRNSFKWNMVLLPVITAIGLGTNILLVRTISLETYAVYMILISFKSTLLGITDLGLSTSYTKFYHQIESAAGRPSVARFTLEILSWKTALLTLALVLLAVFNQEALEYFKLEQVSPGSLLLVIALIVLESMGNLFERYLEVNLRQKLLNGIKLVQSVTFVATLSAFFALGQVHIFAILASLLLSCALKFVILLVVLLRQAVGRWVAESASWLRKNMLRFLKTSFTIYFDKLSSTIMNVSFLVLMITPHFDKESIAYLALAGNFISKTLTLLMFPTNGLILPIFSHYYAYKSDSGLNNAHEYSVKYITFVFLLAAGAILVNAREITVLLYSDRYLSSVRFIYIMLPLIYLEQAILTNAVPSFYVKENYLIYWANRLVIILGMGLLFLVNLRMRLGMTETVAMFCALKAVNVCLLTCANVKVNRLYFPWKFFAKMALIVTLSAAAAYVMTAGHGVILHIVLSSLAYGVLVIIGMRLCSLVDHADWQMLADLKVPHLKKLRWILG